MQEDTLIFDLPQPEMTREIPLQTVEKLPLRLSRLKFFCREGRALLAGRLTAFSAVSLMTTLAVLGGKQILARFGEILGVPHHYALTALTDLLITALSTPILMGSYLTLCDLRRGKPFRPGEIFRCLTGKAALERCWTAALILSAPALLTLSLLPAGIQLAGLALQWSWPGPVWIAPAAALTILALTLLLAWLILLAGQRLRLTARIAWDQPKMPLLRAARRSVTLTRRCCREGLSLSFAPLGMWLAALLTCGILQTLVLLPLTLSIRAVYDEYLLELREEKE